MQCARYERSAARRDTRAGHYERGLQTKAGEVRLRGSEAAPGTPQTRIAELQLENSRLRRLVTDLLLENMKLEEAPQVGERSMSWASRRAFARASTNPLFFEAAEP